MIAVSAQAVATSKLIERFIARGTAVAFDNKNANKTPWRFKNIANLEAGDGLLLGADAKFLCSIKVNNVTAVSDCDGMFVHGKIIY